MSEYQLRVLGVTINLLACAGCITYLCFAAQETRWSRTMRRFITGNPQPGVFWFKFWSAVAGAILTLIIAALLIAPPSHRLNWYLPGGPTVVRGSL